MLRRGPRLCLEIVQLDTIARSETGKVNRKTTMEHAMIALTRLLAVRVLLAVTALLAARDPRYVLQERIRMLKEALCALHARLASTVNRAHRIMV